eukprot:8628234-Alexandrium_andersonii.AAC.1
MSASLVGSEMCIRDSTSASGSPSRGASGRMPGNLLRDTLRIPSSLSSTTPARSSSAPCPPSLGLSTP